MRLLTLTLLTICLNATGQTSPTKKALTFYPGTYLDSESRYTDSTGVVAIIQNSLPKGGGRYTDSIGKDFAYVVFWTRVINETAVPLDLTVNFPADSFAISSLSGSYLKVFLPSDTMTLDKVQLYDYGLTGLESFLDANFNKPTMLQRTINSKEEWIFYIGILIHQASGTIRTELVAKERSLFYRINLLESTLIPCGQIVLRD
jgi:hypothetical protein